MRAFDVLDAFQNPSELLRLSDVATRTGLSISTVFRILVTLEKRGFVIRAGEKRYQLNFRPPRRRRHRIGFAGQSQEFAFSRTVADSVTAAARAADVELLVFDNHYSARAAIRNADALVREQVELVIEFQTDESAAPIVSSKFVEAGIPMIAVEIPHPGATYYGANNYGAGVIGGRHLAKWTAAHWQEPVDEVLLLELPRAGELPRSRLVGVLDGIRDLLPAVKDAHVKWLDGKGQFGATWEAVRRHLRQARTQRVLIAGINDPSTLGGLRAFEEAGRAQSCVAVGQNAALEARIELRRTDSRLIGSVAYFPERYGEGLISLAIDILERKAVPPAVFIKHQFVARDNVNRLYPNDALMTPVDLDRMLFGML